MAKHNVESYDADDAKQYLHQHGHDHLRVRPHGDLLVIESGPDNDAIKHARMRRVTVNYWTLEMATHTGQWQATGLRDGFEAILETLVHDFGWTLTPID